ncbi:MAG: glycine betaine ABC transporter substrate-binding protein, partial [Emcibacteraceae bacterium]|nr:glycine betaine ABC transporter substrate-binding protein [Emcibacteraceae bacterium]
MNILIIVSVMLGFSAQAQNEKDKITIGSKMHGESYLLAEIMAQLLENNDYEVDRKFGFGGTLICYNALLEGEIDIYPEYTGTISEAIFTADEKLGENPTLDDYEKVLNANGMTIFAPFGFSNSYA